MSNEEQSPIQVNSFWLFLAKNWKTIAPILIGIFTFLGGVTYFDSIKEKASIVWNLPEHGEAAIAKFDSINSSNLKRIEELEADAKIAKEERRVLRIVLHNTTKGFSQETDPMQYKNIKFNSTNAHYITGLRTNWLFIEDTKYKLLMPWELKYNVQIDGYEYYDRVYKKHIKLPPYPNQ